MGQLVPGVPLEDRTGREGRRSLAPDLIEAPPLPCRLVVELLDELAGIEVGAPRALVVNARAVGEQRPALGVQRGQAAEGQVVDDGGGDHVADRRAPGDVHHRLVLDRSSTRPTAPVGIGPRRLDAAPVGAGADRDDRRGALRRLLENLLGRAARRSWCRCRRPPSGTEPVTTSRYFPALPVIAVLQRTLGGAARRGHQRVRVVERDQIQDQVADGGLRRAEHALDAPGAFLELDPDDARAASSFPGRGRFVGWPELIEAEHCRLGLRRTRGTRDGRRLVTGDDHRGSHHRSTEWDGEPASWLLRLRAEREATRRVRSGGIREQKQGFEGGSP